ncbi:Trp biosynthesis-associated membrane protein [Nocardioides acrostichi]|uniref:Trp biosynthesis-associated membrane protein n=1 Tax=Nocardioides acrostichi TaxID=2784339 RepID=A0A930UTP5_9ACTN|nr:Trp biosynthesis-associated membrane protein [Nocardioides acrostichi]MBF4160653.1 Trp biosynthesis-associated membrane protein [Nocardioides acrostichi]
MTGTSTGTGTAAWPSRARRAFVPCALAGLGGAAIAAVAGSKPVVEVGGDADAAATVRATLGAGDALSMPLVTSLALVVLAAWGVLLVARGRVRRLVATLAASAALGAGVAVVTGWLAARRTVDEAFASVSASGGSHPTPWLFVAAVGAVLSLAASAAAVRATPAWPEMGRRYDAPTGGSVSTARLPADDPTNLDLWKALDDGHDPTA